MGLEGTLLGIVSGNISFWILVFTILCFVSKIGSDRQKKPRDLPGPRGFPLFGNGPQLGNFAHTKLKEWSDIYGPIYKIKLGQVPVVVLNSYDVITEALVTKKRIFSGRPQFSSFAAVAFGKGIVFNDVETLPVIRERKKLVVAAIKQFALSPNTRQNMLQYIYDEVDWMVTELNGICESTGEYVNPEDVIRLSISNAVCEICFGKKYSINDEDFMKLLHHNQQFGKVVGPGSLVDVMPWLKIIPYFRRVVRDFWDLNVHNNEWNLDRVNEHFKTFEVSKSRDIVDLMVNYALDGKGDSILLKPRKTLQNVPLPTSNGKDIEDIVDKEALASLTVDMFGAAQDTLSSVMLFIFFYMTRHPDIQTKVRDEVNRITCGERPTISHTEQMVYLHATFHEILRHSSPTAMSIPHSTLEETTVAGFRVKRGSVIFVNQYAVNYDEKRWKNPKEFNPDRFINTDIDGSISLDIEKTKQYLIFSIGSRICPAKELSLLWLTNAMASLLQKCEIVGNPDHVSDELQPGLTLKPKLLSIRLTKL